mmetsp:Transcript_28237/g.90483  ORF Transcript_28237/g.90483 Transcript_28237/m.90483 type:complete len:222 (-) Transcript_28237:1164-1829(-)
MRATSPNAKSPTIATAPPHPVRGKDSPKTHVILYHCISQIFSYEFEIDLPSDFVFTVTPRLLLLLSVTSTLFSFASCFARTIASVATLCASANASITVCRSLRAFSAAASASCPMNKFAGATSAFLAANIALASIAWSFESIARESCCRADSRSAYAPRACLTVSLSVRIWGSCRSLSLWLVTCTSGCARMSCASCAFFPAHMSTRAETMELPALCSGTMV